MRTTSYAHAQCIITNVRTLQVKFGHWRLSYYTLHSAVLSQQSEGGSGHLFTPNQVLHSTLIFNSKLILYSAQQYLEVCDTVLMLNFKGSINPADLTGFLI